MRKRRRSRPRPQPDRSLTLTPILLDCPECQHRTYADYKNYRTISTLDSVFRLTLTIRRCPNPECSRLLRPYRPEAESHFALPYHEFGLDVMALVGRLRYAEHRSIPEIYRELTGRGIVLAERTVTNLLDRYDELRALATADPRRLEPLLRPQGRVILAIDGLQPDVGHEVLWIFRDCLSGEILLAQSLLSSTAPDLAGLIDQVRRALPVPITGVVSDGQESIRKAVAKALDGVPHQLCHFHYLREAAKPISEADRHAKKELKKRVRGIRPIERRAEKEAEEGEDDAAAEVVRGYCAAVPRRLDRRWAAAAGGRRAEVARSAEPDRRQLGPCGVPGGRLARGFESAAAVAAARAGGDGRPVAGGAGGLQMGPARGPYPQERGGVAGEEGAATAGATAGADAPGGDDDGRAFGEGGVEAVPEGDPELLAGLVSVLRRGGPAEDEQRPGAHFRQPSLPRASVQWSAAGLAGSGRDGLGAGDLGLGDAAPAGGRLGVASGLCGGLARAASEVGERGGSSGASAMTRPPISRSWSNSISS